MITLTEKNTKKLHVANSVEGVRHLPCNQTYKPLGEHYEPVEHYDLAKRIDGHLRGAGYEVEKHHYVVSPDGSRIIADLEIALPEILPDGMLEAAERIRSRYTVAEMGEHGGTTEWLGDRPLVPEDIQAKLMWRHGLDGEVALRIQLGGGVKVCSNGLIVPLNATETPEYRRRHVTGGMDYDEMILGAIGGLGEQLGAMNGIRDGLAARPLLDAEGDAIIVEAGRTGLMPWARCQDVADDWHEPRHTEFQDRNAWSLFNCFNEAVKKRGVEGQLDTLNRLPGFLLDITAN